MRIRSTGLTLFVGLSILVAACSSATASTAPSAAAPSTAPTDGRVGAAASTAPSEAAVGQADLRPQDRRRHRRRQGQRQELQPVQLRRRGEWCGLDRRQDPVRRGPDQAPSDYEPDLQAYVDQGYNIIVAVGFNLVAPTAKLAKLNKDIWFIGVDHNPCIDKNGDISTRRSRTARATWPR